MTHMGDTDNSAYYDPWLGRYVIYTRLYTQERRIGDRRWIGRAEAEDFLHWGPVEPLIWPGLDGPLSDDIYLNARSEYPGVPEYHLMFPMIYHRYTQTSDVRLFSSGDGICWSQVPGEPVISPGGSGEWDCEFIRAGKHLVPLGKDRVAVPYGGIRFPHKYPRWKEVIEAHLEGWAWWTEGRLCAVVAEEEGEFFTLPIAPAGRGLRMNLRTCRSGEVRVGIVGATGRDVADCDPVYGDGVAIPVHWKGETDIGTKEDEKVTLQVSLRSAEVFGLEWV